MTKPTPITGAAEFDLTAIDRQLRSEDAYRRDGHTARTLIRAPAFITTSTMRSAGSR